MLRPSTKLHRLPFIILLSIGLCGLAADKAAAISDDPLDDALSTLRVTSFDAKIVFDVGEADSVDLRTGNLTFVVPIGGPQRFRRPLSYELQATYNSSAWERRSVAEKEHDSVPNPPRGLCVLTFLIRPSILDGAGVCTWVA